MKTWQRRAIGIMTLGGSSVGLAAIGASAQGVQINILSLVIIGIFTALFVYGIVVGVLVIEGTKNSLSLALPFWLVQVPVLHSPWISYGLFTGAKFNVLFRSDLKINLEWYGGAEFTFYLFPGDMTAVGVNFVAIIISSLIWKYRAGQPDQAAATDAD